MTSLPSLGRRGEGWVVIQVILLAAIALAGWARPGAWPAPLGTIAWIGGVLLVLAGLILAVRGIVDLGGALTPLPHPRDGADLVEHGVYRMVRHPIYGGLIVASLGWALVRASVAALALTAVLWAFFHLKSTREEAWLTGRFAGYAAYRSRTKRFIPWLG